MPIKTEREALAFASPRANGGVARIGAWWRHHAALLGRSNRRGGSWMDCEDIDGGPGHKPSPLIGLSKYYKVPVSLDHRYDDIGFRCARSER